MDIAIGHRPVRDVFQDLALASEHTSELAMAFSYLSRDDSWALFSGGMQNRLIRILLAETLRSARIRVDDMLELPLNGYMNYLRSVSIHCRLTDSDDDLKLASLRPFELAELRRLRAKVPVRLADETDLALRAHSGPTLILVAGIGIVLLESEQLAEVLHVTQTAITVRWAGLIKVCNSLTSDPLVLPLDLKPVRQRAELTAAISALRVAASATQCERLFR